jgi:hypothetical protein
MNRWLAAALCLAIGLPAMAQLNRGTISGLVTDASGAAIPGAQVTIRLTTTNAVTKAVTNDVGQYNVPNLQTGVYDVTVEASGFKKFVLTNLELRVTDVLRVDAKLDIGSMVETVEVSATVERVTTDTPQVGTSLTNTGLIDLPLSFSGARNPENFAYKLTPGVTGSSWTSHINGSTTASKEVLLDGASTITNRGGHNGESAVSLEAISEFKIQTSGMSAEFGRFQAGIFNFVMKSGSNDYHGTVYGALRNEALNANTWVNNFRGVPRAQDRKQNVAVSGGGPVIIPRIYNGKDKTFFYVTYERYRDRTGGFGAPNRNVPIEDFYDGNFSRLLGPALSAKDALGRTVYQGAIYDPATFRQIEGGRWIGEMFPGNIIPKSRFSTVSQTLNGIARKSYLPTVRDANGVVPLVNNAVFPVATTPEFDQHQFSAKGDQIINSNHRVSGSYSSAKRPRLLLDAGGMWDVNERFGGELSKARLQNTYSKLGRVAWDWTVSPTTLLNVNTFYNRFPNPNNSVHVDVDGAKALGIKNLSTFGYPTVNWGGGPYVSLQTPGDPQKSFDAYNTGGVLATLSMTKGRHFIKVGFDHRRNQFNTQPGPGGSFNFAARGTAIPNETFSGSQTGYSFASYLLGIVDSAGLSQPVGRGGRRHYYAGFIQDDFKMTRTLTLNLGLRWDLQLPYFEVADRMASWNLSKTDPQSGLKGAYDFAGNCSVCMGRRYFGTRSYNDFGPRFGLAWQASDKWVVRTAFGLFYEGDNNNSYSATNGATNFPWAGSYILAADAVNPWAGIFNWDNGFPTDRYVPPTFDVSYANRGGSPSYIDPNYGRVGYTQQWNLNIQRRLPGKLLLDTGYVGNKSSGLKNTTLTRINQLPWSIVQQYGRNLTNAVTNEAQAAANGIKYPYPGYRGTVAGALRDYPQIQGINTFSAYAAPLGFSTYHSLQVTLDRQFSNGFSMYANYVWSKTLSNIESSFEGENSGSLDYYNLKLEKTPASYDIPHMFKAYAQYDLPFGKGKAFGSNASGWVNGLIGGWQISGIVNYFSGAPIGFGGATAPLPNGWNGGQRPNVAPGDLKASTWNRDNFNFAQITSPQNTYINKSLVTDPASLTLGNAAMRYTTIRGFGTVMEDAGILKNIRFNERMRAQIRAELLNIFNRHQFGGIQTSVTNPQFGQVTSVSGNRSVQLGARFEF